MAASLRLEIVLGNGAIRLLWLLLETQDQLGLLLKFLGTEVLRGLQFLVLLGQAFDLGGKPGVVVTKAAKEYVHLVEILFGH